MTLKLGQLKIDDERHMEVFEVWCYQRVTRTSWTEKATHKQVFKM